MNVLVSIKLLIFALISFSSLGNNAVENSIEVENLSFEVRTKQNESEVGNEEDIDKEILYVSSYISNSDNYPNLISSLNLAFFNKQNQKSFDYLYSYSGLSPPSFI